MKDLHSHRHGHRPAYLRLPSTPGPCSRPCLPLTLTHLARCLQELTAAAATARRVCFAGLSLAVGEGAPPLLAPLDGEADVTVSWPLDPLPAQQPHVFVGVRLEALHLQVRPPDVAGLLRLAASYADAHAAAAQATALQAALPRAADGVLAPAPAPLPARLTAAPRHHSVLEELMLPGCDAMVQDALAESVADAGSSTADQVSMADGGDIDMRMPLHQHTPRSACTRKQGWVFRRVCLACSSPACSPPHHRPPCLRHPTRCRRRRAPSFVTPSCCWAHCKLPSRRQWHLPTTLPAATAVPPTWGPAWCGRWVAVGVGGCAWVSVPSQYIPVLVIKRSVTSVYEHHAGRRRCRPGFGCLCHARPGGQHQRGGQGVGFLLF